MFIVYCVFSLCCSSTLKQAIVALEICVGFIVYIGALDVPVILLKEKESVFTVKISCNNFLPLKIKLFFSVTEAHLS